MRECKWAKTCALFSDEVGYSFDLHSTMAMGFCYRDPSACARMKAYDCLPCEAIPDDLLPTERDRVEQLVREHSAQIQSDL